MRVRTSSPTVVIDCNNSASGPVGAEACGKAGAAEAVGAGVAAGVDLAVEPGGAYGFPVNV